MTFLYKQADVTHFESTFIHNCHISTVVLIACRSKLVGERTRRAHFNAQYQRPPLNGLKEQLDSPLMKSGPPKFVLESKVRSLIKK
mmetsp:Transcript_66933/g.178942  ORF Transcript_66933/g.178942 Transcript_66933/m.178942 type:complete len:86 (+) Transcript_66933:140-397(+)